MRGRLWTPDEDLVIRATYPTHTPVAEIAARLGRTKSSVEGHAKVLGLRRPTWRVSPSAWTPRAACAGHDPAMWDMGAPSDVPNPAALAICQSCPVVGECLQDALQYEGRTRSEDRATIRGGLTPVERARLARRASA